MTLRVLDPGLYTTVQDRGRIGLAHLGISRSGAMDRDSLRLANLLCGNHLEAAALEMTGTGVVVRAERGTDTVLVGAGWRTQVGEHPPEAAPTRLHLPPDTLLRVTRSRSASGRAYLAVAGGVEVPVLMGSRSTDSRAGLGGSGGGRLSRGDEIRCGQMVARRPLDPDEMPLPSILRGTVETAGDTHVLRVMMGPHHTLFSDRLHRRLLADHFTVGRQADRVGYRLDGPVLRDGRERTILSEGLLPGVIQIPGGGRPILLTADCQTMGGYPVIATVVSGDVNVVGRCLPGAHLRFSRIGGDAAERLRKERAAAWAELERWADLKSEM